MEIIGWIGSIAFTICAIPFAVDVYKQGRADHITSLGLFLWVLGEICTLIYVVWQRDWPLVLNYIGNLLSLMVIVKFKFSPRVRNK